MRRSRLLISCAIFFVLLAWYVADVSLRKKHEGVSRKEEPSLFSLSKDTSIASVILSSNPQDVIELNFQNNEWMIKQPRVMRADNAQVRGLVDALKKQTRGRVVSDAQSDLETFGLQSPSFILSFTTNQSKTYRLNVGRRAPVGEQYYADLNNEKPVFLLDAYFLKNAFRPMMDFAYKDIFDFSTNEINFVSVAYKKETIEFQKQKDVWVQSHIQDKTDPQKVQDFLMHLGALSAENFVDMANLDPALLKKLDQPDIVITVRSEKKIWSLRLAGPDEKRKSYLALGGNQSGLVWINQDEAGFLPKSKSDFLDRTLFHFNPNDVQSIQCEYSGAKKTAIKKEGHWALEPYEDVPGLDAGLSRWLTLISELQYLERKDKSELKALQFISPFHFTLTNQEGQLIQFRCYHLGEKSCLVSMERDGAYFLLPDDQKAFDESIRGLVPVSVVKNGRT